MKKKIISNKNLTLLAFILCGFVWWPTLANDKHASELELYKHLFKNYNKETKPSRSVEIKFALNLNQIVTLIEREQILVINVYLDHEWIDERLKWNPTEFGNITLLRIKSEKLWAYNFKKSF